MGVSDFSNRLSFRLAFVCLPPILLVVSCQSQWSILIELMVVNLVIEARESTTNRLTRGAIAGDDRVLLLVGIYICYTRPMMLLIIIAAYLDLVCNAGADKSCLI